MAKAVNLFCEKALSYIFYWVLDIKKVRFCVAISTERLTNMANQSDVSDVFLMEYINVRPQNVFKIFLI